MSEPTPTPHAQLTVTSSIPVQDAAVLAALLSLYPSPPDVPVSRAQFTFTPDTLTVLVIPSGATRALLTVEGQGRYAVVTPSPDASSGHQIFDGDTLSLDTPEEMSGFSLYPLSGGKIEVTFYAPRQAQP